MAFYGAGQNSHDRHGHDGSYMNRSTTGRAAPVPEPARSATFNPRLDHDMDESDVQLPFRPEPIGIHPHAYYGGGSRREYRDRDRDRDYYHDEYRRRPEYEYEYRRHRDRDYLEGSRYGASFNMSRGYGAPSSQAIKREYEEYLHRLRRENPAVYKEWYKAYQANPKHPPPIPGFHVPLNPMSSSASSVANYPASNFSTIPRAPSSASHYNESKRPGSGRSSVTDDYYGPQSFVGGSNAPSVNEMPSLPYDMYNSFMPIQDDSMYTQSYQEPTVTPKFPGMHCFAIISPLGQLLTVKNGATTIEVNALGSIFSHLPEYQKIKQFPGPLIRGKVHKHTVIAFCERKIKEARTNESQVDLEGFVLLWEFLILLLRQNGSIVGSDVAELLVRKEPEKSQTQTTVLKDEEKEHVPEGGDGEEHAESKPFSAHPLERQITEAQAVKMFGDYLLFGHTKEALEYAMKSNLWGHALTLAFKMGDKEHRNVMTRFINGMPLSMPIVTLFEVMGGKSPASLANCCDASFGDWKQHLAIILSNAGWKPECETKSIIMMGDTLGSKHHNFCSQFCYLMANLEFSPESKLGPLLGLLPDKSNVVDAILMTEIYEFARTLADPHYSIGSTFLEYKYEYVKLLIDYGFSREAYSYCEEIVKHISQRDNITLNLKWSILQVAERLKSFDESSEDPSWIANFKHVLQIDDREQNQNQLLNGAKVKEETGHSTSNSYEQDNVSDNRADTQYNQLNYNQSNQIQQPEVPSVADQQQQQFYQPAKQPEVNGGYYQPHANEALNTVGENEAPDYYSSQPSQGHQNDNQPGQNYAGGPQYYTPPNTAYNPPEGVNMNAQQNLQTVNGSYYPSYPTEPPNYVQSQPSALQPNKKKVRFEDEDLSEEEGSNEEKTVTPASRMSFPLNSNSKLSTLKQNSFPPPAFSPAHTSQELALVSNEQDHDNDGDPPSPAANPVVFRSTFPIDEPFGRLPRNKSAMSAMPKSRTFPVDEQCCDVQRPCDEHDGYSYQYGSADFNAISAQQSAARAQGVNFRAGDKGDQFNQHQQQQSNIYSNMPAPQLPPAPEPKPAAAPAKKSDQPLAKGEKQKENKSSSWLGSLVPKFPFKPKNQMILPEDKDPAIVWDDTKKQWVNTKGDDDDSSGPKGPPPTDFELTRNVNNNYAPPPAVPVPVMNNAAPNFQAPVPNQQPQMPGGMPVKNEMMSQQGNNAIQTQNPAQINSGGPPSSAAMNKYKLPKGRTLRSSYVDVFNPGSGTTISATGANPNKPAAAPFVPPLFVPAPAPIGQAGDQPSFLTPGGFQPQPQSDNQGVPNIQQ